MTFIKIFAERNTSSNFLKWLLKRNYREEHLRGTAPPWVGKLQSLAPGSELIRDLYFMSTRSSNMGWKHSIAPTRKELDRFSTRIPEIAIITMSKNPYSWLLSMYRNPYHQPRLSGQDFHEFLSSPWHTVRRENTRAHLIESPIELWNLKNRSYSEIWGEKVIHVRTEDLYPEPRNVLRNLEARFHLTRREAQLHNHQSSTKNENKSFDDYSNYYTNEEWRAELSQCAIELINASIDTDLMRKLGYEQL